MSRVRCQHCRLIHLRRLGEGHRAAVECRSGDFPNESSVYDAGFAFFSISNCFRYVRLNPKLIRWSKWFLDSGVWRELCCWSYRNIKKMWDISDLESMKKIILKSHKEICIFFLKIRSSGWNYCNTSQKLRWDRNFRMWFCGPLFFVGCKNLGSMAISDQFHVPKKGFKALDLEDLKMHPVLDISISL